MTGILTGYNVPTACKVAFCGKSTRYRHLAEATVGGYWPAAFKTIGYDGLIINGKASKPAYLHFADGKLEVKDAAALWGKDVFETLKDL